MARLSSKLVLAVVASSLFLPTLLAQEKNSDGNPPKDQKPGDDKPKEGPPRDETPKDAPPKGDTSGPRRNTLTVATPVPLSVNIPGQCVGNHMTNGNIKTIIANPGPPSGSDNIHNYLGWTGNWKLNSGAHAEGGINGLFIPDTDRYLMFWVTNVLTLGTSWREGAKNKLSTKIQKYSGNYTLSFVSATTERSANSTLHNPSKVGLYAVYFPPTQVTPSVSSFSTPSNIDLYGPNQVIKIGTVTIPTKPDYTPNVVKRYEIHFSASQFSAPEFQEMTHLMVATDDDDLASTVKYLNYVGFDDFCLTKDNL
jgi:hypothetical protein